jgi:hypothetical protein
LMPIESMPPGQFLENLSGELQSAGYLIEGRSGTDAAHALLYARSRQRYQQGFAKIEDHFFFIDWDYAAFGRLDRLLEISKQCSGMANQGFHVPHALRLQIPNLAIIAVSPAGFPPDMIQYTRANYLTPWYGGETGQLMLVDLEKRQLITHAAPKLGRYPTPGAFPLGHALQVIRAVCQRVF